MKYMLERDEMEQFLGDGFVVTLASACHLKGCTLDHSQTFTMIAEAAIRRQTRRYKRLGMENGTGAGELPTGASSTIPATPSEFVCRCGFPGPGRTTTKGGLAKHKTDMGHWEAELTQQAQLKTAANRKYVANKKQKQQQAAQTQQPAATKSKGKVNDIERKNGWLIHTLCGHRAKSAQAMAGHVGPCRGRNGQPYKGHRPDLVDSKNA